MPDKKSLDQLCLEKERAELRLAQEQRMPSAELEKTVNERGIFSRTMRTAKSRIGDRLVTEKDGTAWVCYLRDWQQEHGKRGKDGKVFIDTLMLPPCLVPSYRHRPMMNSHRAFLIYRRILNEQYRNQHRPLPDCQKADWQDHLYRPCAFQPDRKRNDGGQNQASAPWGSPQNVTSFWIWWKSPWLFVSGYTK